MMSNLAAIDLLEWFFNAIQVAWCLCVGCIIILSIYCILYIINLFGRLFLGWNKWAIFSSGSSGRLPAAGSDEENDATDVDAFDMSSELRRDAKGYWFNPNTDYFWTEDGRYIKKGDLAIDAKGRYYRAFEEPFYNHDGKFIRKGNLYTDKYGSTYVY